MEKQKAVEELERLAATLAQARDDASDVANRALRENRLLKEELRPLLVKLFEIGGSSAPGDTEGQLRIKQERDRAVSFIHELGQVFTGGISLQQFAARDSYVEEKVVVSNVVTLITDAAPARWRLELLKRVYDEGRFTSLSKATREAVLRHLANSSDVPFRERPRRRKATKRKRR